MVPDPNKPFPSFPGIGDRALKNLAARLSEMTDVNGQDQDRAIGKKVSGLEVRKLMWHLVEFELLEVERNAGLLRSLSKVTRTPEPHVLTELVTRLPASLDKMNSDLSPTTVLDEFSLPMDYIVFDAYHRDRDHLLSRVDELAPNIRLGLTMIRRRCGEEIEEEDSREILRQLAANQTKGHGFLFMGGLFFEVDGKVKKKWLKTHEDLRELTDLFGTAEEWNELIVAASLNAEWVNITQVGDALVFATPGELATILTGSPSTSVFSTSTLSDFVTDQLKERDDDPADLMEVALQLRADEGPKEVWELLGHRAWQLFREADEAVPQKLKKALYP